STPNLLLGRSRTCPMDALTINPESRYFWIVLTLVGDSTMTRDFLDPPLLLRGGSTTASGGLVTLLPFGAFSTTTSDFFVTRLPFIRGSPARSACPRAAGCVPRPRASRGEPRRVRESGRSVRWST